MKDFQDKVAVVTGAASGIGHALAEKSAQEGMNVVLADVEERALKQAEEELKASGADVWPCRPMFQRPPMSRSWGSKHSLPMEGCISSSTMLASLPVHLSGIAAWPTGSGCWASTSGASFMAFTILCRVCSSRTPKAILSTRHL